MAQRSTGEILERMKGEPEKLWRGGSNKIEIGIIVGILV